MERELEVRSKLNDILLHPNELYSIFLFFVIAWCSLIFLAPIAAAQGHSLFSGVLYLFFSNICHQIPERSFFILGKQVAVCSRCTGLYLGFLFGAIVYPFLYRLKAIAIPPKRALYIAMLPISIDVLLRTFHVWDNSFLSRSSTGFILGAVTVFFVLPGVLSLQHKKNSSISIHSLSSEENHGTKTR